VTFAVVRFFSTIQKTTISYAPGLFHCYDLPDLPRTNNCPFAEIKMTFSNFGQKAGFYRQTCSKLLKAVAFFARFP
jgi:hypothetical protein